jgi:putative endonuclease
MLTDSKQAKSSTKQFGLDGESLVCDWMQKQGFTILARNYRTAQGEIDIIARIQSTIVFVEVKTRRHTYFALSDIIVPRKQKSIIDAARRYCAQKPMANVNYRFDVAFVQGNNAQSITYIPNAFAPENDY